MSLQMPRKRTSMEGVQNKKRLRKMGTMPLKTNMITRKRKVQGMRSSDRRK